MIKRATMLFYNHLRLQEANKIIILKNKGYSNYKINKKTGISKGKIRRCLFLSSDETWKARLHKPWKGKRVITKYSFRKYKIRKNFKQLERAYNYAKECEPLYLPFIKFRKSLYDKEILGIKVKRSASEYIKEFKRAYFKMPIPKKVWVYRMAHSPNYSFKTRWLVKRKWKNRTNKNTHEQVKPRKYNSIEIRENKNSLRSFPGNFEIDSVIGKRTDRSALVTMIDINTGDFYMRKHDGKAAGFAVALKTIISENSLKINTMTMDNGGENNLLHTFISEDKLLTVIHIIQVKEGH